MASQDKLQLDEPIYPYWVDPDVKNNPWNKLLTPRICLSHQTGFANWRRMTNNVLTFKFQPGTQSSYSGEGYFYVARFAQHKVQKPFDQLAQQYVLGPVGMNDTSFTTQRLVQRPPGRAIWQERLHPAGSYFHLERCRQSSKPPSPTTRTLSSASCTTKA